MKRLERLVAALTPKRWPVRWRLAAVSAALTFLILVIFALVVGRLTSSRLHTDFNDDLARSASTIASEGRITFDVFSGRQELRFRRDVNHIVRALPSTSVIQVADAQGTVSASTS